MNLNGIVSPVVAAVSPLLPISIRISTGSDTAVTGKRTPSYATPGALTASIAGDVLTATAVSQGTLQVGQTLADLTATLLPGTTITGLLTGTGGPGTYSVAPSQTVASEAMTTSHVVPGKVQPLTMRDLTQIEGLNLGGVKWKLYLNGKLDGIVRPERKGGDLITIPSGPHAGIWLVAQVLEQYPDWCSAAITLQNGA